MPFAATWMDLEIIILILGWPKRSFEFFYNILWKNLNELFGQPNNMIIYISKSERERQILYDITYVCNLKIIEMNLETKQKLTHRHRKQTMVTEGEGGRGGIN